MSDHTIKYSRSTKHDWMWKAECSCGWIGCSAKAELVADAQRHVAGTEWIEADPNAPETVAA